MSSFNLKTTPNNNNKKKTFKYIKLKINQEFGIQFRPMKRKYFVMLSFFNIKFTQTCRNKTSSRGTKRQPPVHINQCDFISYQYSNTNFKNITFAIYNMYFFKILSKGNNYWKGKSSF